MTNQTGERLARSACFNCDSGNVAPMMAWDKAKADNLYQHGLKLERERDGE